MNNQEAEIEKDRYKCDICGYIYNPSNGDLEGNVSVGTEFKDIPGEWTCPVCGGSERHFAKE